jgi:hypothetical protein
MSNVLVTWPAECGLKLPVRTVASIATSCKPELDVTPLLSEETANYCQTLIGSLVRGVELGRMDIIVETSMLASSTPGCALFRPPSHHISHFGHLKDHHDTRIVFNAATPEINYAAFKDNNWEKFRGDATKECAPGNAPEPSGNPVALCTFVDSDHAADSVTRRVKDWMHCIHATHTNGLAC